MPPLSRRQFLGAAGSSGLLVPLSTGCDSRSATDNMKSRGAPIPPPFSMPFKRPAVIRPSSSDDTTDYFDVRAYVSKAEILPGVQTEIFSYNGTFPGPTFEVRKGRTAVVRTVNDLPVPISTHLHGGVTPAASDGYPTDLVLPASGWTEPSAASQDGTTMSPGMMRMPGTKTAGEVTEGNRDYTYPNRQRAATLWYHDHRMDFTGPQVWRGLAGFYLIHDDEQDLLPLPKGERDLPVMIMDRAFNTDGSLAYPSLDPELKSPPGVSANARDGMTGDVILVNGVPWPRLQVDGARYRLRLLNASNARRYQLTLDPAPAQGTPFTLIASDAGLLERPQDMDSVHLVPGERFDVIVDFSGYPAGTDVILRNALGDGSTGELMQFGVGAAVSDPSSVPATLATVERLDPADAVRTRSFNLANSNQNGTRVYTINGQPFSTDRIWAEVKRGETEIWEFTSSTQHPIHLHLAPFQIYQRGGSDELEPEDAGWKDTARMRPRERLSVLVRFDEYTGTFVFHCHNLEHEDMAMMANFRVS